MNQSFMQTTGSSVMEHENGQALCFQSSGRSLTDGLQANVSQECMDRSKDVPPWQDPVAEASVLISVVMPCLNEARTLAACIEQAHAGCRSLLSSRFSAGRQPGGLSRGSESRCFSYEVIIADNGSSDGSQDIAAEHGARLINVQEKGYGAALRCGIAAARGKYVLMGDSDCSYDFGEVARFVARLEQGYDLVMGNRFLGEIKPGAMPWHHRYIGNPVLSWMGRFLYGASCGDWHCGLRAFDRHKIEALQLQAAGMEFASELVLRAAQARLRISEIPIVLYPDGRDRPPHLRSFRDGWRHVKTMLRLSV